MGYPSIAAGFRGLSPRSHKIALSCCDGDGLIIDAAMAKLKAHNLYQYQLITLYYVKAYTLRTLARRMGISHNEIASRLQYAEGFIEGCLACADKPLVMNQRAGDQLKALLM